MCPHPRPQRIKACSAARLLTADWLYGQKALEESVLRANELEAGRDHKGKVTWCRITSAVQLVKTTPPGPVH